MRCSDILAAITIPFILMGCMPITPQPQSGVMASPIATPQGNRYTGIKELDAIVDRLLAQDTTAIVNHIQFTQIPCTTKEGLGGPPKCEPGQEEETVVEVFPIVATHGFYLTPDTIEELRLNLVELYAVYEVPEGINLRVEWPIGHYGLIFRNGDPVPRFLTIYVADGSILWIRSNFVESPEEALPASVSHILYQLGVDQVR